jgi:hypothetical protein
MRRARTGPRRLGRDHRLRRASDGAQSGGPEALSQPALVGALPGLRPQAEAWRGGGRALSEGAAARRPARCLGAQWRPAGQQPRLHARALSRGVQRRAGDPEPVEPDRPGRPVDRFLDRHGECGERLAAGCLHPAGAEVQGVDRGAVRGCGGVGRGDRALCRGRRFRAGAGPRPDGGAFGQPALLADPRGCGGSTGCRWRPTSSAMAAIP